MAKIFYSNQSTSCDCCVLNKRQTERHPQNQFLIERMSKRIHFREQLDALFLYERHNFLFTT